MSVMPGKVPQRRVDRYRRTARRLAVLYSDMSDIPERILRIEPGSVVVPVGAAGSGKTTWVRHNFPAEQVVSLDDFRILMTGADAGEGGKA
jgi:ABC-type polar amino acid transport system ATPase subunit